MRLRAAAAGLLALAALALPAGTGVAAPAQVAAPSQVVSLKLTSLSPPALTPDQPLVIRGTLRNPGPKITKAALRLRITGSILSTRDAVEAWASGEAAAPSERALPGDVSLDSVNAGTTVPFTLTVPAGRTGLADLSYAFGPRGLTVDLATATADIAQLRTTVVWAPASQTTSARLSLLVPITSSARTADAGAASAANAELLARGGRLQRVLDATSDEAFDWAIDPAVLQAADRLSKTGVVPSSTQSPGGGQTTDPPATSAPGSSGVAGSASAPASSGAVGSSATGTSPQQQQSSDARGWLTEFTAGRSGRVVLGLPYADPDLNSVLDNGQSPLLRMADQLGKDLSHAVIGGKLDRSVAWPGDGKVSGKAVAGLDRAGRADVLLASGNQPPTDQLSYTPTGRSTMRAKDHKLNGLIYDEKLSALLAASGGATSVASTQTMLATLAAIGMQHPADPVHVLAVAPRDWNPDPAKVASLISTLHGATWVSLRDLNSMREENPAQTPRVAPIYTGASRDQELPAGQVTSIARLNDGLSAFAPAATDPEPGLTELREQVASLVSVSWRGHSEELWNARLTVSNVVTPVATGVRLLSGSKLFTAKTSSIPVFVQNNTGFAVKVTVSLRPRTGQLAFGGPVTVRIDANARKRVLIKTRALASGDVNVEARLITPAGQQLGPTSTFQVRVRPNWETWGLIGGASILGLLLVVGLLRGVRRDRERVPPESVPDVDDIATRHGPQPTAPATGSQPAQPAQPGEPGQPGHKEPGTRAVATKENR